MTVVNGQLANSTTFNNAFLSRLAASTQTVSIVALENALPDSGAFVANLQKAVNKAFDSDGTIGESDATAKTYANHNYIGDGDNRKVAIGKLDAQLKLTQDDLDATEATILDHETRLDTAEATLADHESRIDSAETTISDHETRLDTAEATLADHESRIDSAETTISDHETRLDTAEATLADHESRIDDLEAVTGTGTYNILTKSADYTIDDADVTGLGLILLVTTSTTDRTITLPTLADNQGKKIIILKADSASGKVIVEGESTETINTSANATLTLQSDVISVIGTAATWAVESKEQGKTSIESWTPTGSWNTNVTYTGFKKRIGDLVFYSVQVALSGAPNSATLTINLPSGEVIDTTKLFVNGQSGNAIRSILPHSNGTVLDPGNNGYPLFMAYHTTTAVAPYVMNSAGTFLVQTGATMVTQAVPITFANGDILEMHFAVPIVGY